mmetsp:Transcript_5281/g.10863  ORF Transcript_5281/g.10863 Transcript_5281/m.10863 type:complete len:312 (+) Transcript_5281:635-1570(+)
MLMLRMCGNHGVARRWCRQGRSRLDHGHLVLFRHGGLGRRRISTLVNTGLNLSLRVRVDQGLRLELNLGLNLLLCRGRGLSLGRFLSGIDNGLGLHLRQCHNLGRVHGLQSSSATLGGRHDGLSLRRRLHHGLGLRLNLGRRNIGLLPPGRGGLQLLLQLLLELLLNLTLQLLRRGRLFRHNGRRRRRGTVRSAFFAVGGCGTGIGKRIRHGRGACCSCCSTIGNGIVHHHDRRSGCCGGAIHLHGIATRSSSVVAIVIVGGIHTADDVRCKRRTQIIEQEGLESCSAVATVPMQGRKMYSVSPKNRRCAV